MIDQTMCQSPFPDKMKRYWGQTLNNMIERYIVSLSLQRLCDYVCDLLLEESNVQPVSTPVTVCGDIHGQVKKQPQKDFVHSNIADNVGHIRCEVHTAFSFLCVFLLVLWSLWTVPNRWSGSRHKLHIHGWYIEIIVNYRVTINN